MTGQMNFDSHTSDVVALAVRTVNLLTPGAVGGRPYAGGPTPAEVRAELRSRHEPTGDDLAELRGYADSLRAIFVAKSGGDMDAACDLANDLLRDTQAVPVLSRHDGEPWHLHFHAADTSWARGLAASLATAIAIVLGNPMHDRLGVCTAPACDRVYVDTSRNGLKRFCSTACQNRVKAAAFRARKRG